MRERMPRLITSALLLWLATLAPASYGQQGLSNEQIRAAYYKSYTYEKSGNYSDAIKALQLIYQAYPRAYGINNRLGYLYGLKQKFKNAEHHYKQAITALPGALGPKSGLMYTYLLAGRYQEASELGYQILKTDYYNYYGNLRLAHALRKLDNTEMAEAILIKMLTLYPSDVLYLTELGLLTLDLGERERTATIMNEVLILDPENITANAVLLSMQE